MQDRYPRKPSRTPAAMAATLAVAVSLALGGACAFAQSAADDEDVPLDTKLFRQLMKELGLKRDGEPGIEYRERAPLVVPPSRDLPPPQKDGAAAAANPSWPKDPDVNRRKQSAAAAERARLKGGSADGTVDDARPLRPDELDRGRAAARPRGPAAPDVDDANRPLSPTQMGEKRTIFDFMSRTFNPGKPEAAPFTGEPVRESMTAPPPGYQTPSPDHPYGIGQKDTRKASTVVDRVEPAR